MAIKITLTTYKDIPMATFWDRVQVLLVYCGGITLLFCLFFLGLPVTNGNTVGMVFWSIGAIVVTGFYVFAVLKFCGKMIDKAIKRYKEEQEKLYGDSRQDDQGDNVAKPSNHVMKSKDDILMLSQLAAYYVSEQDEKWHQRYIAELRALRLAAEDAQAMFDFDCAVIKKYNKNYLLDPDFTHMWFFGLKQPFFLNYPKTKEDILKEHFLTVSELCKIIDEAEWHYWNSHEREMPNEVWKEIYEWHLQGDGGKFAVDYFKMISGETQIPFESMAAISNSQGAHLNKYKWG